MKMQDFSSKELAAFQAYTRLTVVAHAKAKHEGMNVSRTHAGMSFKDFFEIIEKDEVVNPYLSREIDLWQQQHSELQRKMTGNHKMEGATMNYIEKAYELGLVDPSGHLYQAKV
ncbi:hypothetical protein ACFPTR_08390 [Aliibacillus thermotolerans]|uniref:Uncharacterized protein n=1 Tax=Aliibacillus thermotolerans TaxID=1834418 RepID=A0ABW0U606_9BACI|nr:hypothetical protein [Aliibacillus thermotolerans]MDA3129377.1 hypothetical protein [Aliibacillus thermotolerans]